MAVKYDPTVAVRLFQIAADMDRRTAHLAPLVSQATFDQAAFDQDRAIFQRLNDEWARRAFSEAYGARNLSRD